MSRLALLLCPVCSCPIQRTVDGRLVDGLIGHVEQLHDDATMPQLQQLDQLIGSMIDELAAERDTDA